MKSLLRIALATTAILAVAGAAVAEEGRAKWNQERVTKIAVELADAAQDLQNAFRKLPPADVSTMQSTTRLRLRDTLRVIKNETKHLASALQDGEGYEETLPAAKRIDQLLAQAAEDGRRLMLPDTVMDEVTRTGDLVNRLRPYYGGWEPPHA